MHSLGSAIYLAPYSLDVRFPHRIGFFIGMAYIVTKEDALTTNITLSHLATSSTPACPYACILFTTLIYYQKYMEKASKKNLFLIFAFIIPFFWESC